MSMRRAALASLFVLASACTPSTLAPTEDAASTDASAEDAAVADASPDAGWVSHGRPYGYRDLHPACGVWSHTVDDPSTYDTTGELAIAMMDARCRRAVACGEAGSSACDPIALWNPADTLHAPVITSDARACLAALESAGCSPSARDAAESLCTRLIRGGAPDGSPCSVDRGCQSLVCEGATAPCGGTCRPAFCTGGCGAGQGCARGVCVALPGAGAPCIAGPPSCAPGLVCLTGTCERGQSVGDPCMSIEVVPGSFAYSCLGDDLGCDPATHLCARPVIVSEGESCDAVFTRCAPDLDCVDPGRCAARPGAGEACRAGDRVCAAGLGCNADGACAALVGPGCDCTDGSACPWALRCVEGSCQRIGVAPVACTTVSDCFGAAECIGGTCTLRLLGAACDDRGATCREGHCRPAPGGFCTPTVPSGGSCELDPYGCGTFETCIGWRTCGVSPDQQNACAPGWP